MSDSVRLHRWQPTRLPRPWDYPGNNTGVGCHFLLQCIKVKSESEVAKSCPTLSDPMDCSPPGSSVQGILQARVLEWAATAFSDLYLFQDIKPKSTYYICPQTDHSVFFKRSFCGVILSRHVATRREVIGTQEVKNRGLHYSFKEFS